MIRNKANRNTGINGIAKKRFFYFFWVGSLLLLPWGFLAGCSEILEVDISQKMVTLLSPADSTASRQVAQTFRWAPLEGARSYRLEIGSPDLLNPSQFFVDTLTKQTSLRLPLQAGRFEWRLRAVNAGYETNAIGRTLRIDSSQNLAEQSFRLLSPGYGTVLGSNTVTFRWETLPMATRYVLKVTELSSSDTTASGQFTKLLPQQTKTVTWQVTALNATSRKDADTPFQFTVDLTATSAPTLLAPLDNAYLQSLPLTLSWQRNSESVERDSVFLYTVNQTPIAGFPRAVAGTSFRIERSSIDLGQGTYYWAVRSVRANGQASSLSEKRRFSILY